MSRDIGNTASTVEALGRVRDRGGCRKPVWSSLLSLSRAVRRLRWLACYGVLEGVGVQAGGPLPGRGRRRVRASLAATQDVTDGDRPEHGRADRRAAPSSSPPRVSMPAPTRSAGTSNTTTSSVCRERRSTAPCAATGSSPRHRKKRPRSSYIRFQAEQPNEMWQADFTHYPLTTGDDAEILSWLDDHARYALSRHRPPPGHRPHRGRHLPSRRSTSHGAPASTLDRQRHGVHHPPGRRHEAAATRFETELRRLGITQKNSRPNHPTTCGKVERFQQTMKTWLRAQPDQPATIAELQALLDVFVDHLQPPRAPTDPSPSEPPPPSPTPPAPKPPPPTAATTPTTASATTASTTTGSVTLRHDGHLHHIGLGHEHARTPHHPARRRPRHPRHRRRHRRTPPPPHPRPHPRLPAPGRPPGPPPRKRQQPEPR